MAASLHEKKGVYYAVFRIVDSNGVLKQKWVSTGIKVKDKRKKDAQKIADDIEKQYNEIKIIDYTNIKFSTWVEEWLEVKKGIIDIVTYQSYESYCRIHIIPYFKKLNKTLQDICPQDIQNYYVQKQRNGNKRTGKGLSGKTLRDHHVVIKGALDDALRKNMIPFNPADRVILPKKSKFTGSFYTSSQVSDLLKAAKGTNIEEVITLTVFYGLRRSEVTGLKWDAINFDANVFEIKSTVVRFSEIIEKETTKNKPSHRTYPMTPEIVSMFKRIKRRQMENRLLHGESYTLNEYVFTWPDGRLLTPDYISRRFSRLLEENMLPHIRFHDLRHTTASLMLANKMDLQRVQEWLGHGEIGTTIDIYGHLDFSSKCETSNNLSKIISLNA